MKCIELVKHKHRLDALFEKANLLPDDPEMQAHWARYLCVLVSGFLENSVRLIYRQYVRKQAGPKVITFVEKKLREFTNPMMDRMYAIAGCFSPDWESELRDLDNETKSAVGSVVHSRHKIAHGESVDLTLVRLQGYYVQVVRLVELMERQCEL